MLGRPPSSPPDQDLRISPHILHTHHPRTTQQPRNPHPLSSSSREQTPQTPRHPGAHESNFRPREMQWQHNFAQLDSLVIFLQSRGCVPTGEKQVVQYYEAGRHREVSKKMGAATDEHLGEIGWAGRCRVDMKVKEVEVKPWEGKCGVCERCFERVRVAIKGCFDGSEHLEESEIASHDGTGDLCR